MGKLTVRMITVLVVAGIISGGTLAGVYSVAQPLIVEQEKKALRKAIFVVLPDAESYKKISRDELVIYRGFNSKGAPVGVAFVAEGPGFQGNIKLMVGLDNDLKKLKGMTVLESVETPGLGGRITESKWQNQFRGLLLKPKIEYVKGEAEKPNEVEAITGATISSAAVVRIINKQIKKVSQILGKES